LADGPRGPRVAVLADDLIWADRLARTVVAAGGRPARVAHLAALEAALADPDAGVDAAIVDLTARAYDGIAAVERAASAGVRVLAVGQHDDLALRKRALAAGAERVLAYRKLFEDGPATMAAFLAGGAGTRT
jgi:DNA-binding NarL/FixJ family response regulator